MRHLATIAATLAIVAALMWARSPEPGASIPRAPVYDPMNDVDFAADCVPCPNDPWLYCCRSMGVVGLGDEAQALLAQSKPLEQRMANIERMFGAFLSSVNARVAQIEKSTTPKKRSKRTAKAAGRSR